MVQFLGLLNSAKAFPPKHWSRKNIHWVGNLRCKWIHHELKSIWLHGTFRKGNLSVTTGNGNLRTLHAYADLYSARQTRFYSSCEIFNIGVWIIVLRPTPYCLCYLSEKLFTFQIHISIAVGVGSCVPPHSQSPSSSALRYGSWLRVSGRRDLWHAMLSSREVDS